MKQLAHRLAASLAISVSALTHVAVAQAAAPIPPAITTPDRVQTRIGTLEFKDGAPSKATLDKVYDNLDFTHAFEAFVNTFQGVSIAAIDKGLQSIGVKDNEVIVFSELMDAKSLFLTANADTIYFIGVLDLTKGPMVLEAPPSALGAVDDYWFRWVTDFGPPGPDRGDGREVSDPAARLRRPAAGGWVLRRPHARTTRVVWFARSFIENNDPKPVAELIRKTTKIYPYEAGGVGTPIAEFLAGKSRLGGSTPPPPTVFHEGSGKPINTIPPNDFSYYEMLNEVVQQEPATSLDPELMGPIAAIGIVKGKPFAPDARMKKILTEAARGRQRHLAQPVHESSRPRIGIYYPSSAWKNMLFDTGYEFETPIPLITHEGVKPFPPTGYRMLDARTAFFYGVTGITPGDGHAAARHRLAVPLWTMIDANKKYFDGAKTYKVTLPKDIPAGELLVVHAVRQPDALDARHAAALSARGQPELSVARRRAERRRLDDGLLRPEAAQRASSAATGFRRCPARASFRSCASTARSSRSSPRHGGRARSSWPSSRLPPSRGAALCRASNGRLLRGNTRFVGTAVPHSLRLTLHKETPCGQWQLHWLRRRLPLRH